MSVPQVGCGFGTHFTLFGNALVDLRLSTDHNLDLSLINVPNHILVLVILSSVPEFIADIGGVLVL